MNFGLLASVFVASLAGSLHCAAMCGGFVGVACHDANSSSARRLAAAAYHAGRLSAYVTVAALSGALGSLVNLAGNEHGVASAAALVSGAVMVLWGLCALLETQGVRVLPRLQSALPQRLVSGLARLAQRSPIERSLLLGLSSALLPCGWLYGFVIVGAGTGSVLGSMAVLTAFWAGNLPLLLGLSVVVNRAASALKRYVPFVSALALTTLGLFTVLERVNLPALALSQVQSQLSKASGAAMPADCPYHRRATR